MKKQKLIFGLTLALTLFLFASLVSAATMTRTAPSTSDGNFQVTYTATASGTWGASIEDSVSGGCKFPGGTSTYRSVMLSPDGNTKRVAITAPASGTCTFNGNYKFGNDAIVNFQNINVQLNEDTQSSCLFSLGTFCVKIWMIIVLVVLIILFFLFKK